MNHANATKHDPDTCDACREVAELANAAEVRELENRKDAEALEFAGRFRLNGDLLHCIECNRGIVASRMEEDFVHAASCKLRTIGGRPWTRLQAILCGPLVDATERLQAERDALKAKLADPRRVLIHETEVVATKEEIATLRSERDKFANWIAMEHRSGPDWACAQCKPPTHGNNMVVEGFVCIRHQAMAIAAARGGA